MYKAADSSQAAAVSQKVKIHLAFLDINLPGKSGLELGEELRQHNQDIELIIVTAYQNFHYAKQSIRLGVVDYMTKPVIQSELVDILSKYRNKMPQSKYSHVIHDALTIIHEKYADKLALADLAAEVHINPTYLSRRFHDEVGVSFSEYLMQYRIQISKNISLPIPIGAFLPYPRKAASTANITSAPFSAKVPTKHRKNFARRRNKLCFTNHFVNMRREQPRLASASES